MYFVSTATKKYVEAHWLDLKLKQHDKRYIYFFTIINLSCFIELTLENELKQLKGKITFYNTVKCHWWQTDSRINASSSSAWYQFISITLCMFCKNTSHESSQHGVNCVTVQNDYNHHRLSPAGNIIVADIPISTELCVYQTFLVKRQCHSPFFHLFWNQARPREG